MKRIEVHSHKPRVSVYLTSVNLEKDKRYKLAVEKLTVPAIESRILNTPLFEVGRRIRVPGVLVDFDEDSICLDIGFEKFTPQNVRSLSHLAFQLNQFFKEFQLRITTAAMPIYDADDHEYSRVGTEFERELGADWYTLDKATQLSAVVRSDGRLGFKFGVDFQKLFILEFTEVGHHTFEFEKGPTHNKFILTGTDLQNFNVLLVHRVHTWKTDKFVQSETEYEMPPESTFILRFSVRPVK